MGGHRTRLIEKFSMHASAFTDVDLLELLLTFVIPRQDTRPIAKNLLNTFKCISRIITASATSLCATEGVGPRTATLLRIVYALSLRIAKNQMIQNTSLHDLDDMISYCKLKLLDKTHEELHVIFLNAKNHIVADELIAVGSINNVQVSPREIVKHALENAATGIFLTHNHPSKDPTPSREDIELTKQIQRTMLGLNIKLYDHIIIGGQKHFSFSKNNLL